MESKEIVNQSLRYIEEHLEQQVTLEEVALNAGYSEFHFSRIFKSIMGMTVMEYVTNRKLIKASEEILQGKKIIEVAMEYGWQSHSGFTKAFKKQFGFYPTLLRAMMAELGSYGGSAMNHVFLYQTEEHTTKEQLYEILKNRIRENQIEVEEEQLQNTYQYACEVYADLKRYSGDEYVTHPLNVAILLAELGGDGAVILAGMFCDAMKKTKITPAELEEVLPERVVDLIMCVANIDNMFAGEVADEVIMIKMAERLHNMRTVQFMNKEQQKIKAKETVEIYMPLARKLKNDKLIAELNDLSIRYM